MYVCCCGLGPLSILISVHVCGLNPYFLVLIRRLVSGPIVAPRKLFAGFQSQLQQFLGVQLQV